MIPIRRHDPIGDPAYAGATPLKFRVAKKDDYNDPHPMKIIPDVQNALTPIVGEEERTLRYTPATMENCSLFLPALEDNLAAIFQKLGPLEPLPPRTRHGYQLSSQLTVCYGNGQPIILQAETPTEYFRLTPYDTVARCEIFRLTLDRKNFLNSKVEYKPDPKGKAFVYVLGKAPPAIQKTCCELIKQTTCASFKHKSRRRSLADLYHRMNDVYPA